MNHTENALQKTLGFGAEEFVRKALEGGWKPTSVAGYFAEKFEMTPEQVALGTDKHAALLDPAAWRAVGKVEGWEDKLRNVPVVTKHASWWWEGNYEALEAPKLEVKSDGWYFFMHRFIDALVEENV